MSLKTRRKRRRRKESTLDEDELLVVSLDIVPEKGDGRWLKDGEGEVGNRQEGFASVFRDVQRPLDLGE